MSALHRALEFAASGVTEFITPAPDAEDYAEFQAVAEALLEAKEDGLVYEVKASGQGHERHLGM